MLGEIGKRIDHKMYDIKKLQKDFIEIYKQKNESAECDTKRNLKAQFSIGLGIIAWISFDTISIEVWS